MGQRQPQRRRYHLQALGINNHNDDEHCCTTMTKTLQGYIKSVIGWPGPNPSRILVQRHVRTLPKPTYGSMNCGSSNRGIPRLTTGPRIVPSRRASESPLGTA
ncbi:unnamed protein product, partial [Ectocarpus sp. 12 AP-2014]